MVNAFPAVANDLVPVASRGSWISALNADTGAPVWARYDWFSWIESSGVLRGRTYYVGSSDLRAMRAIDARTGDVVWETTSSGGRGARPRSRPIPSILVLPARRNTSRSTRPASPRSTAEPGPSDGGGPFPPILPPLSLVTGVPSLSRTTCSSHRMSRAPSRDTAPVDSADSGRPDLVL
jgi:hypothetical protein